MAGSRQSSASSSSSQWISEFEATATSSSTINCRWKIEPEYAQYVRELRISLQPEYNPKANLTDRLDLAVTQYTLSDLNSNTRYKVCLRIITPQLTDERSCVDVSTAFGFVPALIGSLVGLVAAFLILACFVALSKYMQKRGVWVFRTPKVAEKRSPEEKSLLSRNKQSLSPTKGPQDADASKPNATRTPSKPIVRPEHLVEEIYCGEDDSPKKSAVPSPNKQPPTPPPPPIDSNSNCDQTQANSILSRPTSPNHNHNHADSHNALTGCGNANGAAAHSAPNGKLIVTEALVTPECTRENAHALQSSCQTNADTSGAANENNFAQNDKRAALALAPCHANTQCADSGDCERMRNKKEQLDNEKNESMYKNENGNGNESANVHVHVPCASLDAQQCPCPAAADGLVLAVASQPAAVLGSDSEPTPLSDASVATGNHVASVNRACPSRDGAASPHTTIQMNDAAAVAAAPNGNLLNANANTSANARPPTGIYMQFVETL